MTVDCRRLKYISYTLCSVQHVGKSNLDATTPPVFDTRSSSSSIHIESKFELTINILFSFSERPWRPTLTLTSHHQEDWLTTWAVIFNDPCYQIIPPSNTGIKEAAAKSGSGEGARKIPDPGEPKYSLSHNPYNTMPRAQGTFFVDKYAKERFLVPFKVVVANVDAFYGFI